MPEEADALRAGGTCSYRRPRLQPFQRRPTAAEDSGSYSGHGRRISVSTRPGEKRSDQSRVTMCAEVCDAIDGEGVRNARVGCCCRVDNMGAVCQPDCPDCHCGMRCSHTGIRSFQPGRSGEKTGTGRPPRRGGEVWARHAWVWPVRESLAVHEAA